jgi:hypothetical protein
MNISLLGKTEMDAQEPSGRERLGRSIPTPTIRRSQPVLTACHCGNPLFFLRLVRYWIPLKNRQQTGSAAPAGFQFCKTLLQVIRKSSSSGAGEFHALEPHLTDAGPINIQLCWHYRQP